jgi:ABC-2 type transport system ATP-binding protein
MTPALHIQGLKKTYKNGFQALKGIDLVVEQGDFFALLGPNGAGKSTTIGIMSSLINKSEGKVFIFGLDIDTEFAQARRHIGLVPQEFNFNMFEPVEEIVANQAGFYGIPRREAREATEHYLRQLGLWSKRREIARQLSGGMKRRLMIARALVHRPRLLVLDEPTAGVDIEMRRSMWEFFTTINAEGTTIILTTHYLEEAENLCRHIAIIDEGRIVEQTNLRRLLDRLHVEQFVFYLKSPLEGVPQLPGFELHQVDPTTLEVCFRRGGSVNALFQALTRCGIQVSSMKNKVNRLEELFIDLVGNSKTP